MHLFSRTAQIDPEHSHDALAFCVDIATYVSSTTGLDVIPWTTVYGAPVGTVSWSARVESQAQMGEAQAALLADEGYMTRVSEVSRMFTGPTADMIAQFVAFAGDGGNSGQFASVVTAQCAPGRIASAMAWGVDIMNQVSKVTGRNVAMVRSLYGAWAGLGWISMADTLADVDAATEALAADTTYVERLDEGGDLFVAGSAEQRLLRRLA